MEESAVEVKDKNSLHRALRLIAKNTVGRREYDNGILACVPHCASVRTIGQLKSDVRLVNFLR
jgi:hypothetical protein